MDAETTEHYVIRPMNMMVQLVYFYARVFTTILPMGILIAVMGKVTAWLIERYPHSLLYKSVLMRTSGASWHYQDGIGLLLWWLAFIPLFIGYAWLIYVIYQLATGERTTYFATFRHTLSRVPSLIISNIFYLFIVGFGMLLFIIPGIYWVVQFAFYIVVCLVERRGPWRSITRSRRLVKGNWFQVFTMHAIPVVVYVLLILILQYVLVVEGSPGYVLQFVASCLQVVFIPFISCVNVVVYLSLAQNAPIKFAPKQK